MNYINYKKNELIKLKISDIGENLPDLKNVNKAKVISEWLMNWLDSVNLTNHLLPTKEEFAYTLGVSLGTIQNVFKILEDKEYIFLKQRIGAVIKNKNSSIAVKKQTSKADITFQKVKDYIADELNINDTFPPSRTLAKKLNVSLHTIRLSINKLINDGTLQKTENVIILVNKNFENKKKVSSESLVNKIKDELKKYIAKHYKIGDKLSSQVELAEKLKVSVKTIHNAIKLLEKEEMLLSRRGTYGTIVINTSMNSAFEPRREMSIFASAQETAFYHYEKVQNKIKKIITENYSIGSKLPSILEFSKILDLSPNTIRKALNNLAQDGILRFSRGRYGGTYVIDMPDIEEQTFKWLAVNSQYTKIRS